MMETEYLVWGVTSVDDELFVLLVRDDNQVAVYSINDYQLLRHLNLPGLKPSIDSDMTSCVRHKCLYMSDRDNCCIHRYDLSTDISAITKRIVRSHITKWQVPGDPRGLSVTPSCNLLVTCEGEPSKLVELSADSGQCVREIALRPDIVAPCHSVQLTTGQYVVCDGKQLCVVGDDGKVTHSCGGQRGFVVGQGCWPHYLAVDEDSQCIFVADEHNDRVVLLSPTLEFVRYVIQGLSGPSKLYLHQSTRRLFVVQEWDCDVAVILL